MRYAMVFFFLLSGVGRLATERRTETVEILRATYLKRFAVPLAWWAGIFEILMAVFFAIGLFTQIIGALAAIYAVKLIILKDTKVFQNLPRKDIYVYVFVFAIGVTLMILGPGPFAMDLPF